MTDLKALIERWRTPKYRDVMLPGAGTMTCGEFADALASLSASVGVTDEQVDAAEKVLETYNMTYGRRTAARLALEAALSLSASVGVTDAHRSGIYIASKTKHAARWREARARGYPINSTWIDEAGAGESGDLADLWRRCIAEASSAKALVLYREPDDVLKGGWIELGAALASGVKVFAVGIEEFTVAKDPRITHCPDFDTALEAALSLPSSGGEVVALREAIDAFVASFGTGDPTKIAAARRQLEALYALTESGK